MFLFGPLLKDLLEVVDYQQDSLVLLTVKTLQPLQAAVYDSAICLTVEICRQVPQRFERQRLDQLSEQREKKVRQGVLTRVLLFGKEHTNPGFGRACPVRRNWQAAGNVSLQQTKHVTLADPASANDQHMVGRSSPFDALQSGEKVPDDIMVSYKRPCELL